ncbi:hypothetical protein [Acaryochloris sp. IP29b_bin.137]|nr:hypothetical protein [Acaryochloris sp. IP29b_bin.137]
MTQLAPIQLDDGTVIYIKAEDDVSAPPHPKSEGATRTPKGMSEVVVVVA